jgi:hypothetical protein
MLPIEATTPLVRRVGRVNDLGQLLMVVVVRPLLGPVGFQKSA